MGLDETGSEKRISEGVKFLQTWMQNWGEFREKYGLSGKRPASFRNCSTFVFNYRDRKMTPQAYSRINEAAKFRIQAEEYFKIPRSSKIFVEDTAFVFAGISIEHHGSILYWIIPNDFPETQKWVRENKPKWVEERKK